MYAVPSTQGGLKMTTDIEQLILDKRSLFEKTYRDIIIWFRYEKELDSWYFLMIDKRHHDSCIERILSNLQLKYANLDVLWYEFESMRRRLML